MLNHNVVITKETCDFCLCVGAYGNKNTISMLPVCPCVGVLKYIKFSIRSATLCSAV